MTRATYEPPDYDAIEMGPEMSQFTLQKLQDNLGETECQGVAGIVAILAGFAVAIQRRERTFAVILSPRCALFVLHQKHLEWT